MESKDAALYLEDRIRYFQNKLGKLGAQMDALQAEVNRTEAILNSAKILLKEELARTGKSDHAKGTQQSLSERISSLSFSEAITEIVNSSKAPIHADQVLRRLREAGRIPRAKNPKNSVVSLLHRGVKSGLYRKVGPNLFAATGEFQEAP